MSSPIGVFGGIFDPVHYGHLSTAALAAQHLALEPVIFVPAGIPPHKVTTVRASPEDRLAMLRIALAHEPYVSIWEDEVKNAGISYTVDTLEKIARNNGGHPIYFIMGADNLHDIHTWHRYTDILDMAVLCVTERPGFSLEVPPTLLGAKIVTFPSPRWGMSSTMLRGYLAQGLDCRHLIPDGVREYILDKGLYRSKG